MQLETPAHKISCLYLIPSGRSSENRDLYESISMPDTKPTPFPVFPKNVPRVFFF